MKKLSLLLLILLIGAGVWFYYSMPKQVRLSDTNMPPEPPTEEQVRAAQDLAGNQLNPNIQVYFYKKSDIKCETPVALKFDDLDKRVRYQEINALYALLTHTFPDDYQTAIIPGTELISYRNVDGSAKIDLNVFMNIGKDPCGPQARKKQVIMTMQQFTSIKDIEIRTDGKLIP